MIRSRRCSAFAWLAVCTLTASAGEVRLPPITGQLSGEVTPLKLAGAPRLHWTVDVKPAEGGAQGRLVDALFEGPGTRLHVAGNFTTVEDGTWRILEGEVDLETWFPVVAGIVGEALQGMSSTGVVRISGEGTVQAGEPRGTVRVTLVNGRIESHGGWTLEAVGFAGKFDFTMPELRARSVEPFELTVGNVSTQRFGARNFRVRGELNDDRTLKLTDTTVEVAGGNVTMDPTMVRLAPMFVEATLHLANVGLQDVAALVPYGLAESHGRVDGTLRLGWKEPDGFLLGAGVLNLNIAEAATVRLAPAPGFLTGKLPKRFGFGWMSVANPFYADMEAIELGRAPLAVETLTVQITPDGDDRGRTASVHMKGHPLKAEAGVKSVAFDVNVSGPIADVINLGIKEKQNISVGTH